MGPSTNIAPCGRPSAAAAHSPAHPGAIAPTRLALLRLGVARTAMRCSLLSSPGPSFLISLYLEPLAADLGLSVVQLSPLYSATTLAAVATLPFVRRIANCTRSGRSMSVVLRLLAVVFAHLAMVCSAVALGVTLFASRLLVRDRARRHGTAAGRGPTLADEENARGRAPGGARPRVP